MGPRDQVQAGRSCPALAGGRLDRLWPASREWRHRRFVVWTWNVTSDRAGRAELNAPQDTVIVAWAATWEEASVRNGVTTASSSSTDHGYSHRGHGPASAQRSTGSPDRCSRSWRTSPVSTA